MTVGVRLAGDLDSGAAPDGAGGPVRWTCALVNNMPDAALVATERQFVGLLDAGSGCETLVVTRHTMAGVPGTSGSGPGSPPNTVPSRTSPRTPPTCWW
jgi:hypothetical protein